jgi:Tol biopolymer transport system component
VTAEHPPSYVGSLTPAASLRAAAYPLAVVLASVIASCIPGRSRPEGEPSVPLRAGRPELFGEGVFTTAAWDFFVTFTPDQRTAYFCRANGNFTYFTILETYRRAGRWTEPRVASFSGRWSDADPHISPDGAWIYWISDRPLPGDTGVVLTKGRDNYDIWFAERLANDEWGEPRHLGPPVSSPTTTQWSPSVATTGNLYFGTVRSGGRGGNDIWMSRLVNGVYQTPENLGDSVNTRANEVEPWIAPDESYLIFSAEGRPSSLGDHDLYISYRRNGVWQRALHLPAPINSPAGDMNPSVSPDGKYLYFSSTRSVFDNVPARPYEYRDLWRRLMSPGNGLGDIYRVEMEQLGVPAPAVPTP